MGLHSVIAASPEGIAELRPSRRDIFFVASDFDEDIVGLVEVLRRKIGPAAIFIVAEAPGRAPSTMPGVDEVLQRPVMRDDLRHCLRSISEPDFSEAEPVVEQTDTPTIPKADESIADEEESLEPQTVEGHSIGPDPQDTAIETNSGDTRLLENDGGQEVERTTPNPSTPATGPSEEDRATVATIVDDSAVTEATAIPTDLKMDAGFDVHEPEFDMRDAVPVGAEEPRQMRVLVAEDNKTNRLVIEKMLKGLNIELTFAENGQEAVDHFQWQTPDILFTDISMPKLDGKEAARRIRCLEDENNADRCPIIAITAHAMDGDADDILAAGIDHYMTKPVKKAELIKHLLDHCPSGAMPVQPEEDQAAAASAGR